MSVRFDECLDGVAQHQLVDMRLARLAESGELVDHPALVSQAKAWIDKDQMRGLAQAFGGTLGAQQQHTAIVAGLEELQLLPTLVRVVDGQSGANTTSKQLLFGIAQKVDPRTADDHLLVAFEQNVAHQSIDEVHLR